MVNDYEQMKLRKAELENKLSEVKAEALYAKNTDESYENVKKLEFEIDLCESALNEIRRLARGCIEGEIQANYEALPRLKSEYETLSAEIEKDAGDNLGRAVAIMFSGAEKHARLAGEIGRVVNSYSLGESFTTAFQSGVAAPVPTGGLKSLGAKIKKAASRMPGTEGTANHVERQMILKGFGSPEAEKLIKHSLSGSKAA